jgi:hypothetical protein
MLTAVGRSRRFGAAAVVVVLLGLTVAASRGAPVTAPMPLSTQLARTLADTILYAGAAWVILTLLAVVWALWPDRSQRVAMPERPPPAKRLLAAGVAALVLVALFYSRRAPLGPFANPENGAGGLPRDPRIEAAAGAPGPGFDWTAAAIVLGLLLILAFVAVSVMRQRLKPASGRLQAEVAQALDESLDDLRMEPDFRRAVIAAYSRMERALGRHGLARLTAETPFEYLARALAGLEGSERDARRLTELFERAKFSPHVVDAGMRDDAVAALEGLRAELRPLQSRPVLAT